MMGLSLILLATPGVAALVPQRAEVAQPLLWTAFVAGLLLAALTWLRLWHQVRRRLRERDAALRELCSARRRAARAAAQRARMMALITHELRTPLSGMLGMMGLLRGTPLTPEQANYVQAMDGSGRLLMSMVNELLENARAEATGAADATTAVMTRPFHLARMVEEVCELLSARAHARGLALACFVDPRIAGTWLGDEARIRQVLLNLLGNALKFTSSGGVLVRLERREDGVLLSVEDTGPGVPPELESHIFRPFTREAGHDAAREGGFGLGLAIVRQLVELMGGRLRLRNRPGEGATFLVHLPLKPADDGAGAADSSDEGCEADESARQAPLQGARVALAVPEQQHDQALADYVAALGGTPLKVESEQLRDWLNTHADEAIDIMVDAAHAQVLQEWLRDLSDTATRHPRLRVWLLLAPEERLRLHDLMQDARLAGYLLKPVRRRTIIERLGNGSTRRMIGASARALRDLARDAARTTPTDAASARDDEHAPLVLLAEDDPVSAQVARIVLRRAGFRVASFADGRALLEDLRRRLLRRGAPGAHQPVCVLLDMHMPGMDGLETAQAIRQLQRQLDAPRLPLVALTAGDEQADRARCLAAGMDAFLRKPLDADEFRSTLRDLGVEVEPDLAISPVRA